MWRDDAYLLDMLLAARKVVEFTTGVSYEEFLADEVLQHATMRLIQIIGEAAQRVSFGFKQEHPEIPWREMAGMRNKLVHDYFRMIPQAAWEVVETDILGLISFLEPLVPPENPITETSK
jgi:uncharacterized protein with HEPN domain